MKKFLLTFWLLSFLFSCKKQSPENTQEVVQLTIAPYKKQATGLEGKSDYFYVKENDGEWHILFSYITGFDYEKGNEYKIKALKSCNYDSNIPDAPACGYNLIEVIEIKPN